MVASHINQSLVKTFIKHAVTQGLSLERIKSLQYNLNWYLVRAKKPFNRMSREDINQLIYQLEKSNYSEWTKFTRKAVIMKFIRYLLDDKHPTILKDIHLHQPKDRLVKADLLTYDELKRLLDVAPENWRALYAVHYDGNFRKKEILNTKLQDLTLHENYGELSYRESKTQTGTKILTLSVPYLLDWLEKHPTKDNPKSNIFQTYHKMWRRWIPIRDQAYIQHIKRDAIKAGLKKRVYTHLFRHSRTTQLIQQKTPLAIVERSGRWKPGSRSLQRYIHLGDEDYRDEMLVQAGLTAASKVLDPKLITCPWCQTLNPPGQTRCKEPKCRRSLDPWKQAEEDKKLLREVEEFLAKSKKLENP